MEGVRGKNDPMNLILIVKLSCCAFYSSMESNAVYWCWSLVYHVILVTGTNMPYLILYRIPTIRVSFLFCLILVLFPSVVDRSFQDRSSSDACAKTIQKRRKEKIQYSFPSRWLTDLRCDARCAVEIRRYEAWCEKTTLRSMAKLRRQTTIRR